MTYEEAIKELKQIPSHIGGDCDGYELRAISLAIEALNKQISKKPIIEESRKVWSSNNPFETVTVNVFTCPCCAAKIMYRALVKRCLECGQAIDWSDLK